MDALKPPAAKPPAPGPLAPDAPAVSRVNTPDALLGSVLVLEAAVKALMAELSAGLEPPERAALAARLRGRVEASLGRGPTVTRFGTGAEEIADAVAGGLAGLFEGD